MRAGFAFPRVDLPAYGSIHERLVHQRVDHLPVTPANAARRMSHPQHGELLARVYPPVGAARAWPREIADRSHRAGNARRGADRDSQSESIVGAGRVSGLADQVLHIGGEMV